MRAIEWVLAALVLAGALPVVAGCYQIALAGLHRFRRAVGPSAGTRPRVAILIPAWNEAAVVGRTIDTLLGLEYPADRLRVYVIDDASTDATPDVVRAKAREHAGRVFHLRREHGGEGKAHTLNHGLRVINAEDWYEAVLIIDADVIFTARSLSHMVRHLADPRVGAVTAYIKEGSRPANYMNRFIAYEYVNAQAGARRALNLMGAQACLAGGAQLIRRESLEAIGGAIDTSSLAEDTVTTMNLQLSGRRVVFEPHAIVWAEEPRDVAGLWKQRLRWARGNVQVTRRFHRIWLRGRRVGRLGSVSFALVWFSVLLMPLFMVASSGALVALFLMDRDFSVELFRGLWAINLVTFLFVTLSSFSLDPQTARAAWRQGVAFPGLVSLAVILYAAAPAFLDERVGDLARQVGIDPDALGTGLLLFAYVWLAASMLAAYAVKRLEVQRGLSWLARPLVYVVGFGPILCAITAAAYVEEARGTALVWEKTEKLGAVGDLA